MTEELKNLSKLMYDYDLKIIEEMPATETLRNLDAERSRSEWLWRDGIANLLASIVRQLSLEPVKESKPFSDFFIFGDNLRCDAKAHHLNQPCKDCLTCEYCGLERVPYHWLEKHLERCEAYKELNEVIVLMDEPYIERLEAGVDKVKESHSYGSSSHLSDLEMESGAAEPKNELPARMLEPDLSLSEDFFKR